MENLILIVIVLAIIGLAAGYIIRVKKQGKKCVGCPDSGSCSCGCSGACSGNCSGKST